MFHGYDFDSTMLRIGSMNMLLHGIESPDIRYRDSLSEGAAGDADKYTLILANPPFAGSLDYESTSKDLQRIVKTKKTELLFLALFLKLLKPGGRAAVIVPDGVLFGSSTAHKALRKTLVEDQKLDAVVKLPSGVFRPYAGVSTAILFFTKTNSGGTDDVWFYDVRADGFSLDDKRNPVEANDLPDVLTRWQNRDAREGPRPHRAVVPRPQGRHRRPGLRPLAEPLQGDRPRRDRAPRPAGDHRRHRDPRRRDRQGPRRAEGDALVNDRRLSATLSSFSEWRDTVEVQDEFWRRFMPWSAARHDGVMAATRRRVHSTAQSTRLRRTCSPNASVRLRRDLASASSD